MRRPFRSLWVLAGIGLAGGVFSALFGVGGGLVIVPLLILLAGFESKRATGTSLAAIGFTAAIGAATFSVLGEVEWVEAGVVGVPAVAGTLAGTWVQQRLSSRRLVLLFAAFLLLVAFRLLVA